MSETKCDTLFTSARKLISPVDSPFEKKEKKEKEKEKKKKKKKKKKEKKKSGRKTFMKTKMKENVTVYIRNENDKQSNCNLGMIHFDEQKT